MFLKRRDLGLPSKVALVSFEESTVPKQEQKARESLTLSRASLNNPGDFLLSHTVTRAVPSAPAGLTSVFGMGTGVTLPTESPEKVQHV